MGDWNPFATWLFSTAQNEADTPSQPEKPSSFGAEKLSGEQAKGEATQIADNRSFLDRFWGGITKEGCPNCGKSGGQRTSWVHVGFEERPGIVTLQERRYDRHGNLVGTTEREAHVMKRCKIVDQRYQCYICGNEWERRLKLDITGA